MASSPVVSLTISVDEVLNSWKTLEELESHSRPSTLLVFGPAMRWYVTKMRSESELTSFFFITVTALSLAVVPICFMVYDYIFHSHSPCCNYQTLNKGFKEVAEKIDQQCKLLQDGIQPGPERGRELTSLIEHTFSSSHLETTLQPNPANLIFQTLFRRSIQGNTTNLTDEEQSAEGKALIERETSTNLFPILATVKNVQDCVARSLMSQEK